ncbi:hypothetical protein ABUE31_15590 [Mesorhizobium sp. ZMM04-5]|uniref:Anti-sigma factor NepR domain-containing protein n=1 Tax=Mesorhizobium marinum TaxID=3228790 RepID=A0ABV3R2G7_9HYPH
MSREKADSNEILRQEIRKQLGSAPTRRFARTLPLFRIEHHMPERFLTLMAELDRAEAEAGPTSAASKGG